MNEYQVGIYLRLSKEDEKLGESGSITNQRAILMNYIKEHQLCFVSEYIDDGVSGTTFDREGFQQMIQDIEDKKINMVLTKDTSRLGRDHIEFGYYVEKYFPEHQVRYVAVCDSIDTFYSNNDMLLFKSAYNDMYVKDISNKIRASLNIKKKNGEFVGAYAPYGYQKDIHNKHKLVVDEEAAGVVRRIFQLFVEGFSITKIGKILTNDGISIPSIYKGMNRGLKSSLFGVWNSRTITDILTNPTYMGNMTQGRSKKINYKSKKRIHTRQTEWVVKENSCPAIISSDMFEMVQQIYQSNKNRYSSKRKQNDLLLKGFVFCKECGHTIGFRGVKTKSKTGEVYERIYGNCNYYLKHKHFHGCTSHSILYSDLEKMVLEEIKYRYLQNISFQDLLLDISNLDLDKCLLKMDQELHILEKNIELDSKKLDQLYEDKLSGFIDGDQYSRMKNKIMKDTILKKNMIKKLQDKKRKLKEIDLLEWCHSIRKNYKIDRFLLSTFLDKITLSEDGEIGIYYKMKKSS